jgi:hypothetical protein
MICLGIFACTIYGNGDDGSSIWGPWKIVVACKLTDKSSKKTLYALAPMPSGSDISPEKMRYTDNLYKFRNEVRKLVLLNVKVIFDTSLIGDSDKFTVENLTIFERKMILP